jgi:hypothetical protein
MNLKLLLCCQLISLIISPQAYTDGRINSVHAQIDGRYVLSGNPGNKMSILRQQDGYQVELTGGSVDAAGAGTSADCVIHASGILQNSRLIATFEAIDTDTFLYTNAQAKSENRKIEIKFARNRAIVKQADTLGYCGYGANFKGIYRRKSHPK